MKARQVKARITYDNKDISTDIAPFLKSVDFKDSASNEADDISITLEDRKELWEGDWLPSKGASLKTSLIFSNWENDNSETEFPLGTFEVDEIELSGSPHEVKIKAVSIPNNNELRNVSKNKSWENIKLSTIAKEIADNAGMKLYLNLRDDDEMERVEQKEESDLAFLVRIAKEKSYGVRLSDTQLDIYYVPDLDVAEPMCTIKRDGSRISSYSFKSKTRDVYKAAHVRYENTKKGELIEYTFTDPDKKEGSILEIHNQVENVKEAETLAKGELRAKNKDEVTGSISFGGVPKMFQDNASDGTDRNLFLAGFTVKLDGFHAFDEKFLIESTSHSLSSSGYSCNIKIRRCLNGY